VVALLPEVLVQPGFAHPIFKSKTCRIAQQLMKREQMSKATNGLELESKPWGEAGYSPDSPVRPAAGNPFKVASSGSICPFQTGGGSYGNLHNIFGDGRAAARSIMFPLDPKYKGFFRFQNQTILKICGYSDDFIYDLKPAETLSPSSHLRFHPYCGRVNNSTVSSADAFESGLRIPSKHSRCTVLC